MKIEFRVHGVSRSRANVPTEVDGEMMTASVPCLEVELVTTNTRSGNLTLRLVGAQIADGEELFKQDAVITADFDLPYEDEPVKDEPAKTDEAPKAA